MFYIYVCHILVKYNIVYRYTCIYIRGDIFNVRLSLFQNTLSFLKIILLHNVRSLQNNIFIEIDF